MLIFWASKIRCGDIKHIILFNITNYSEFIITNQVNYTKYIIQILSIGVAAKKLKYKLYKLI